MPREISNKMKVKKEKKNTVEVPTEIPSASAYEQAATGANPVNQVEQGQTPARIPSRPPTAYTRKILCARLQSLEAQDTSYKSQLALIRHQLDEIRSEIYRVEHELFRFSDQGYDNY